jgi:cell division septation protein DedD
VPAAVDTLAALAAPAAPVARVEPAAAITHASTASSGDYLVAVGVFASREHVNQIVDALERAGLPAMQRALQRGTRELNQIVLGPFLSRADADRDLQRLRQLGGFDDARVIAGDPVQ